MFKVDNYILGMLYGDGHFQSKKRQEWFFFSSTHKELANRVKLYLDENSIDYFHHVRDYHKEELQKYEQLEIVEITDRRFIKFLVDSGLKSNKVEERIRWNKDFIRGYIETKASVFSYKSRDSIFWRIAFSGTKDDMKYLKHMIESKLNGQTHNIVQRKDKEYRGVISESYRLSIQSRETVAKIIEFIDSDNMSAYLKESVESFKKWHSRTPFNMKRKVFKHYKNAVLAMARELNLTIKGVRGGGGKKGWKPVYLWEGDIQKEVFEGWEDAYNKIRKIYEEKTGYNPPKVEG